jgi:hypothetical protein
MKLTISDNKQAYNALKELLTVCGSGNPNLEDSEYKESIGLLCGIAFTIIRKMGDYRIDGYFDYVVPPSFLSTAIRKLDLLLEQILFQHLLFLYPIYY